MARKSAALPANATDNVTFVICGSEMFRLRKPINIRCYREGNLCIHEYKPLGISAYGRTQVESRGAFAEEFSSCWHWIAMEKDAQLTKDARQLKSKLLDLVDKGPPTRWSHPGGSGTIVDYLRGGSSVW